MFDHLADPHPPTDTGQVRRRIADRLRRRHRRRILSAAAGAAALAVTIGLLATTNSHRTGANVIVSGTPTVNGDRPSPKSSFLTVASIDPSVMHRKVAGRRYRYVIWRRIELQERSVPTGKVEAVLLIVSSEDTISASFLPDGDVLAAVSGSPACGTTLTSIDPSSGTARTVAHLPDSIQGLSGLTVSPDGHHVAYLADPGCQGGTPIPTSTIASGTTHDPVTAASDDYIAVRNLETGATIEAPYRTLGYTSEVGPVWSPDGTRLAVAAPHENATLILSDSGSSLAQRTTIPVPSGCLIDAVGAWTAAGITESLGCQAKVVGHYNPRHPPARWSLDQIAPSGHVTHSLRLSSCHGINAIEASRPGSPAIVDALNVGAPFAPSGCSAPKTDIEQYSNGQLHSILTEKASELNLPD